MQYLGGMIVPYLQQLEVLAAQRGVPLIEAVRKAGVADSQFYRWRQGQGSPREATAKRIAKAIETRAGSHAL